MEYSVQRIEGILQALTNNRVARDRIARIVNEGKDTMNTDNVFNGGCLTRVHTSPAQRRVPAIEGERRCGKLDRPRRVSPDRVII